MGQEEYKELSTFLARFVRRLKILKGVEGLCLEVNDLALSKYIAGREKDLRFVSVLAQHGLTSRKVLLARLGTIKVDPARKSLAKARIEAHFGDVGPKKPGRKSRRS